PDSVAIFRYAGSMADATASSTHRYSLHDTARRVSGGPPYGGDATEWPRACRRFARCAVALTDPSGGDAGAGSSARGRPEAELGGRTQSSSCEPSRDLPTPVASAH